MHVCFKVNALPAEMRFTIRVNGTEKELDNMTPEASFELDCGEYAVELRSAATASIPKLPDWLIYFSTMVIQGIFHILILNNESNWLQNAHPIFLKVAFTINVFSDINLKLVYKDAIYDEITSHWTMPAINVVPDVPINPIYCPNPSEISRAYVQYARKIGAISATLLLILSYLLYVAIANHIALAAWIVLFILCGMGAAVFFLLRSQNRKQKKIKKELMNFFDNPKQEKAGE